MDQIFNVGYGTPPYEIIIGALNFKTLECRKSLTMLEADCQVEPELRYSGITDTDKLMEIIEEVRLEVITTEEVIEFLTPTENEPEP